MSFSKTHYLSVFVPSVLLGFVAALQLTGCGESPVGLPSDVGGAGGQAGTESVSGGGSSDVAEAGDTGEASQAGEAGEAAGGAASGHPEGGSTASGGSLEAGGTTASGGEADTGGQGGTLVEAVIPPTCTFHTDPPIAGGAGGASSGGDTGTGGTGGMAGAGGSAGTAGSGATVTLQVSPFVGTYLADATGRTLYTYGNDLPGDCQTPPVSNCITDCLISWPIFPRWRACAGGRAR